MEELSASIGIMTNAGLDGSSAGTAMRSGLLAMLNPSKENAKAMENLGIKMTDSNGKFVGIKGIVEQLGTSMEGMTDAQKTATLASLVGTEASSGFLALMSAGPAEIDKMTTSLENSGGASEEAAGKMKDNLKGALEELGGAFETAQISIGTALTPAIQKVAAILQSLVEKFNGLSPSMQRFIAIGALVTTVVLLLVAGLGFVLIVAGSLMSAIAALGGVMAIFAGVMAVVTSPITLIIAGIVALIAIGVLLYKHWDTIAAYASQIWARIKEIFFASVSAVKAFLVNGFRSAVEGAKAIWSSIVTFFVTLWANIKNAFLTAISALLSFVQSRWGFLISATKTIFANYINIFKNVWNIIKNVFLGALLVIITLIRGDFGKAKSYIVQIMGNIRSSLSAIWSSIKNIVRAATAALKQAAINAFNNLKNGAVNATNALKNGVVNGFNSAKSLAISAVSALKSGAVNLFNSMREAVASAMTRVKSAIVDGWNKAKSFLTNIDLSSVGKNIIEGLIGGIKSMVGAVGKAIKGVADKVTGGIAKLLDVHSPSRVMMKLGGYTGEGFAKGIEQSEGMVAKAVNGIGNVAINGVASSSRSNGAYSIDGGRESVMETNVYLDSKQIGRGVQRVIDNGQRQKLNVKTAISGVRT